MTHPVSIQFLGAAGTVTGSKHLLSVNGRRVLLDCGLFVHALELVEPVSYRKRFAGAEGAGPRACRAASLSAARWLPEMRAEIMRDLERPMTNVWEALSSHGRNILERFDQFVGNGR